MLSYTEFMNEGYYDPEETYEESTVTSKNIIVRLKATKFPQVNDCIAAQAFLTGIERDIAHAQFRKNDDGTYYSMNSVTNDNMQKKGIMTALYNFVEEKFGIKIVPSKDQEPGGIEFWKKRITEDVQFAEAKEGGVVLIISNPFPKDGLKRIYMSTINRVRIDNESKTIRVDLNPQFYILKKHGDKIYPEKVIPLSPKYRKDILNMNSSGLYLNSKKTPLWQISCELNISPFFRNYQFQINELVDKYGVVFPITNMKTPPNLY
jgi:hypothetical protein